MAIITIPTYEDVQPYILKMCQQFAYKNGGGSPEEWLSEAFLGYQDAIRTFNPDKGTQFTTWLNWKVWNRLRSVHRTEYKREDRSTKTGKLPEVGKRCFDLDITLSELTRDASMVARKALEMGTLPVHRKNQTRGEATRKATMQFLLELGWTGQRILESFNEIREALLG